MSDRDDKDLPEGGEILTPDTVSGPSEDGRARRARPDRKPLYAIVAGLVSCWFTIFGPPPGILLVPILAPTAIYVGRRVLNRIRDSGGTSAERKQARIGLVAGIVALVALALQITYFQFFFEWEKEVGDIGEDKATQEPG